MYVTLKCYSPTARSPQFLHPRGRLPPPGWSLPAQWLLPQQLGRLGPSCNTARAAPPAAGCCSRAGAWNKCLPFAVVGPLRLYFPPVCTVAPGAPQLAEVLAGNGALTLVSEPAGWFMAFPLHEPPCSPPLPQPAGCVQQCGKAVCIGVLQKQLVKAQLWVAPVRSCWLSAGDVCEVNLI